MGSTTHKKWVVAPMPSCWFRYIIPLRHARHKSRLITNETGILVSPLERAWVIQMKLLIVDDHAAMRRMIGRVVNDMVSDIEECGDGSGGRGPLTENLRQLVVVGGAVRGGEGS